jgi:putative membrane protein
MQFNFDPVLILVLAAALGWVLLRGGLDEPSRRRAIAAAAIFAFLYISPFCALGSSLFAVRAVHHVVLVAALAPLVAGFAPIQRAARRLSLPQLTALHMLVLWAWHAPLLYSAALSSDALFWIMQASLLLSAAVWWARLRQAEPGAAVIALLAAMVLMGLLAALLIFAGRAFYEPHWLTTQAWGFSPLEDQQLAGILMWVPGSAIYLLVALAVLYRSLRLEPAR